MSLDITMQTHRDHALDAAWHSLHVSMPVADPTLAPAFATLIESTFRPAGQPLWLVARRGSVIVALLHLRREVRWQGGVPHHRILGGLGWHGYATEVVAAPEDAAAAGTAFVEALLEWSIGSALHCWRIPSAGTLASVPVLAGRLEATVADPIMVHGPAPRRLEGKPGANQRRLMRQLAETGALEFRHVTDPDDNAQIARHFTRMHSALKTVQQQLRVFDLSRGSHERFPTAWAAACASGLGSSVTLTVGGRLVAIALQLHGAAQSVSWRVARDPSLGRYSLGLAMMDESIECSRRRGDTRYRLGPGDEEYKRLWATDPEPCYRLRAVAPGLHTLPLRLYGKLLGRSIA